LNKKKRSRFCYWLKIRVPGWWPWFFRRNV